MFAALLDTNVLWPSLQRDFLLSMAIEGVYRPLWSEAILAELHRHEQYKLTDRGADPATALVKADRLVQEMTRAFSDALVTGWEGLEGTFGLPDADDEHVLAAAVVGGAGAIVTDNGKHFPIDKIPGHIQIIPVRDFAANTADVDPQRAARALCQIAGRRANPPQTPHNLLDLLVQRYGMVAVQEIVLPALNDMIDG